MSKLAAEYAKGEYVTVGFHADKKNQRPDGELNAEIAAKNHFGVGVPARPFLDVAIAKNKPRLIRAAQESIENGANLGTTMDAVGAMAVGAVQSYISETFIPPPNSPETIKRKGSSHPLIDTGQMRQAITFKRARMDDEHQ